MAKDQKNKDVKNKRHFFKDFKAELKKVIWPTPKQVVNNTTAVIVIVLVTALIVLVLELCFKSINTKVIDNIKSKVRNTTVVENVQETNTAEEESEEQTENTTQDQQEPSTSDEQ